MIHRGCLINDSHSPLLTSSTEPSGGASGQASDIAIHAKEILRVRRLLTSIYQRHCAAVGESEDKGLQRFGNFWQSLASIRSLLSFDLSERALERDYFMTGLYLHHHFRF